MLLGLVTINTMIAAGQARPRLIVGIVVDQLRTDYLEFLQETFGKEGFNRLKENGTYFKDLDFKQTVSDAPSATALIFTGAWPKYNGIPSAKTFDSETKREINILSDPFYRGVNTQTGFSPQGLRLSTISDEIAIDGLGAGMIYSLSSDPQQAVIMSGHAGTGAVWIDDNTGKWASTNYYLDFPSAVAQFDRLSPLSERIDTITWKPLLGLDSYPGISSLKKQTGFKHTFPRWERNAYIKFKNSARANDEITDAAIACIKGMSFGQGETMDMLNIAYSVAPYPFTNDNDCKLELEDAYIRLDFQLARLFEEIDKKVGLDNTLIFLTSTGYYQDGRSDDKKYRIPTGEFSLKRAESLLNSYLSARYGNGDYINSVSNGRILLDHKLIEEKGHSTAAVRKDAKDFLVRMSGLADVLTIDEITSSRLVNHEDLLLSIDPKQAADLYLEIIPGWTLTDDTKIPAKKTPVRYNHTRTPAFIMGPTVEKKTIDTPVNATVLAPTVTSNLHIRAPNGAREQIGN